MTHKTFFKTPRIRDKAYLKRVDALGCVCCGQEATHHHLIGKGDGIMGGKAGDDMTFPLCNTHHTLGGKGVAVHADIEAWEKVWGTQESHIRETQRKLGVGEV